nr:MAG TPA: hypothetical protein [Caudoviricetes sp.]
MSASERINHSEVFYFYDDILLTKICNYYIL